VRDLTFTLTGTAVPEPNVLPLLGVGLVVIGRLCRRRSDRCLATGRYSCR
jgi:hypothetical protein